MRKLTLVLFSLFFTFCIALSQKTVTGMVTDNDGVPLIGANVIIKGTGSGTVTDVDGSYSIQVPSDDAILEFSYIGYIANELSTAGLSVVDISLRSDSEILEEVVVTGTAVGQAKKTLSFSVGSINEEMISAVPSPNVGSGLQGKVSGLRVNQVSGQPGQGTFFQIRSANSIANGQQPLIILDGIYLNGSTLADINPEDIEKVEVLKGSAGASLYGSQAANGVIQIFTKRGRGLGVGDTKITYRGEIGMSESAGRYDVNNFTNQIIDDPSGPQPVLGLLEEDRIFDTPLPNLQDYQEDFLFQKGLFQSHSLSLQGRSEKTNFAASVQRLDEEGVIQSTEGYQRNAFRVNVDHRISDKMDFKVSSMYSTSEQDLLAPTSNGPSSYIATILFLTPMFDLDSPNEEDGSDFDWDVDNTGLGTTNPLYDRANSKQTVDRTRLMGNFEIGYYPTDELSFTYAAGVDRSNNDYEQFLKKGYLSTNVPGLFGTLGTAGAASSGGGIHRSNRINNSFISRFNTIYQKPFGDWNTAFRLSYLYEDLDSKYDEAIGENLAVVGIASLDNAQSNIFIASEAQKIVAHSGFLIADIDYQQKYIFSGLFRREGSSLFGPDERWANYYRLSGAYRITEDVDLGPVDEFKVRASIGTAGIRPTFEQRFETFILQNGTSTKGTLGNAALTPAFSREIEVGFDALFLDAFNLEFSYADIKTEDQILRVPLSGAIGFTGQWRNAGTIAAKVYEFSLGTDLGSLLNLGGFNWNLNITFDKTKQTIDKLNVPAYNTGPGIQQSSLFLIEEGIPFGTMVGETFATSLDQLDGQEVNASEYSINSFGFVVRTEDIGTAAEAPYKLLDENGNPLVQPIGDINPDFRMGFANTMGYKGVSLYTLFDWKKGGDIYNMAKHWMYRDDRHADVSSNPNLSGDFFGSNGLYNVLVANNYFAEDGTFFMLREAALSYNFNPGWFNGQIEKVKLSFIGRNLFTITDYTGFHPDITTAPRSENTLSSRTPDAVGSDANTPNGDPSLFLVDSFNYPVSRTYTFSLSVTF